MNRLMFGAIATGLAAATANAGIIIDSFETNQAVTADMNNAHVASSASGPGILGTERDMSADWIMGPNEVQEIANASSDGYLNFSLGADTAGMGHVVWDGVDGSEVLDPTGLGGVDLTNGGSDDRLAVSVVFDDLPVSLRFRIYSGAGNYSEYYLMLPGGIFGAIDFEILYTSFTLGGGTGADFANVGAIELGIFPDLEGTDLQIDFIETRTPSPGPLTLAGLAGILGATRRRR